MSIGAAVIGAVGGMAAARSQNRNQRRLMDVQYQNQRMLNQHGHDLQMDMWNKTNYGAQVKHMKDAGLNPALMYGSAGQGGTTGSQGGGSAASGNAAQVRMMDMQNMLIGAEMKLKESEANKNNAIANKTSGVDTEAVRQSIAESIARERNLSADKELKVEQKLKTIQETTNLKTVDDWNKVKKGLDELKESKKVTGSSVVDLMTQIGLDPVNNEEDRDAVRVLLALFYGSNVAKNIMQGIGNMKGGKTQIGEIFNNTNIHK